MPLMTDYEFEDYMRGTTGGPTTSWGQVGVESYKYQQSLAPKMKVTNYPEISSYSQYRTTDFLPNSEKLDNSWSGFFSAWVRYLFELMILAGIIVFGLVLLGFFIRLIFT